MISEVATGKTKKEAPKKPNKFIKINDTKEASTNKISGDIGLKKPGSNWERFKSVVTETATKEQENPVVKVKRKKQSFRPFNMESESSAQPVIDSKKQEISSNTTKSDEKSPAFKGLTRAIAIDCEMVGIGNDGTDSMLARISLVNKNGHCIYDKYVKPTEEVTDFRTVVSGIRPHHLAKGEDFKVVQKEVADILKGRILVGHALHNDLAVLYLSHPKRHQRDTSRYKFFKKVTKGNVPSLKRLASELLGVDIQSGEHSSVEDAQAAMQLYQLYKKKWENDIRTK